MQLSMRVMVGFRAPRKRILGLILAGEVETVGSGVSRFAVGERVYAFTMLRFGAYAEYTCLKETSTVAMAPSNLDAEQAAAIPYGGLLALHYLHKGGLEGGRSVLVYGASGAVGTSAVQLAKHAGATVTAACGPDNLELMRSLGADHVIDYRSEHTLEHDQCFDLVLDAVGRRKTSPLKEAARTALGPGGRYVSVDDGRPELSARELEHLTTLAEAGRLKPVIDRRYPLEDIAEAHRYVDEEHKRGNVIITIDHPRRRGAES
jgi:NADPH:quinone reductase-like Zn-dependent oxidoreductase